MTALVKEQVQFDPRRLLFPALLVMGTIMVWAQLWPLLWFMVAPVILLLVSHKLLPFFLSPVWIVASVLWAMGVAGWLTYPMLQGVKGGGLQVILDPILADQTAVVIGVSAAALAAGAAFVVMISKPMPHVQSLRPVEIPPQLRQVLMLVSMVPIFMILADTPVDVLWSRPQYQMYVEVAPIAVLGHQLAVGAVGVLGFLFMKEKGAARLFVASGALIYLAMFFAYGSRRMAMLPVLFALGAYAATMTKKSAVWLLVSGVFSALMLPIPLFVRGLSEHGFAPYLAALPDVFTRDTPWLETLNNLMIFFPITALTAYGRPTIPTEHILLELNPLPGEWVGWYEIASTMGLNRATPFSGIGELANVGWPWVIGVWFAIGILVAILERSVHLAVSEGHQVLGVAIVGLAALFALTVTQYNFRSAQRDLIYAVAVALIVWFLAKLKSPPARKAEGLQAPAKTSALR